MTGEDATGYGTADVQSMSLELDLVSGYTLDLLEIYAVNSRQDVLGSHYTLRRNTISQGVTGEREVSEIRRGRYSMIAAHIETANISDFSVEANQRVVIDQDRVIMEAYNEQTGRAVQSGWTHIDFAPTDRLRDALPMDLEDFRFKLNFSGTGNFDLLLENVEIHRPI